MFKRVGSDSTAGTIERYLARGELCGQFAMDLVFEGLFNGKRGRRGEKRERGGGRIARGAKPLFWLDPTDVADEDGIGGRFFLARI